MMRSVFRRAALALSNPRLIICFGAAWFLTNGWAYLAMLLGLKLHLSWLFGAASAYVTLLWLPFTPEKILTCILALALLKKLFPGDERTLALLEQFRERIRQRKRNQKKDG
ncbi:MAG: hypothetical protein IKS29_06495 [Oscillospiraceae bacterium]|nr:hypothetical protein [Oscillospiraceae bacterium]